MEISRLIFSKETKKKMEEGLTSAQKGKLRWERIKEAEEHGSLASAKNRYEVANVAGFTEENRNRGYQWVSNLISRKYLQEIMHGVGKNGKFEYEYHTVGEPDYSRNKARDARLKKQQQRKKEEVAQVPKKQEKTVMERGKELFGKLKDLAKEGTLEEAKSRADVATLVGYPSDQSKAGYSWVSNLIRRGYLKEKIVGVTPSGGMIASYSLGDKEPMYNYEEIHKRKEAKEDRKETWLKENMPVLDAKEVVNPDVIKINISRGDININVEVVNSDQAIKLITTILKGE